MRSPLERVLSVTKEQKQTLNRMMANESHLLVMTNSSGDTLEHGDVVVIDSASDHSVDYAISEGQSGPLVTVLGGVDSASVKCAYVGYGTITITCDGVAIAPGDAVGTSATPGLGAKLETPTIQTILGIALSSKAAGATAEVSIVVLAGGGGIAVAGEGYYRYSTVVVAAANSTAKNKLGADYVCDGVADEVTINSAVGECQARGGGRVLLLEGEYILSSHILMVTGLRIEGMGDSTVLNTSGYPFRCFGNVNNVYIANMYIKFDAISAGRYGIYFPAASTISEVVVENITFYLGRYCIWFSGSNVTHVVIRGCTFISSLYAILLGAYVSTIVFDDVLITENRFYMCSNAAWMYGYDDTPPNDEACKTNFHDVIISDNLVNGSYDYYNPVYPSTNGFRIDNIGGLSVTGNNITGTLNGLVFNDVYSAAIAGNNFKSIYNVGVYSSYYTFESRQLAITGNAFDCIAGNGVGIEGVDDGEEEWRDEEFYADTVISGNIFFKSSEAVSIQLDARVNVTGNLIHSVGSIALEAIYGWEILYSGNFITSSLAGIQITECDSIQIEGNYFIEIGTYGVQFNDVDQSSICNNCFYGISGDYNNTYSAIELKTWIGQGCDDNLIQGNYMRPLADVADTAKYGIDIQGAGSDDNLIAWNDMRGFGVTGEINDAGTDTFITQWLSGGGTRIGDLTNYSEFEPDGTLEFNGDATVWDDLRISSSATRVGPSAPSFINSPNFGNPGDATLYYLAFNGTGPAVDEVFFDIQLPHGWKEGTDIRAHVHFAPTSTNGGDLNTRTVRWQLTYIWANIGSQFGASNTANMDSSFVPNTSQWYHLMTDSAVISGSGKTISSMLHCRLFRDGTNPADDYPQDVAFLEFDIHYEIDTVGSRTYSSK